MKIVNAFYLGEYLKKSILFFLYNSIYFFFLKLLRFALWKESDLHKSGNLKEFGENFRKFRNILNQPRREIICAVKLFSVEFRVATGATLDVHVSAVGNYITGLVVYETQCLYSSSPECLHLNPMFMITGIIKSRNIK